jgi:hypothetical protein
MRTSVPLPAFAALMVLGGVSVAVAQEPVLIGGGSAPITPIVVNQPAVAAPTVPVMYMPMPVAMVPAYPAACAQPLVYGGNCTPPNVIYFGGPNSYYNNCRPVCTYSPSVIYFGRGEACQRGYAFRHPR